MNTLPIIGFIGGGNMAQAILAGLRRAGAAAERFVVVEPAPTQRALLSQTLGIMALAQATEALARAEVVVWAVKPQLFEEAATPCRAHVAGALQLSIMAGIRTQAIVAASGSARVVRAMPNTPALIGQGITGLYARPEVGPGEREQVEAVLQPTGQLLWVPREDDLDAVTALSGSGPAYVFYFVEAMVRAGVRMGLTATQARQLAEQTFAGAASLSAGSQETPETLRARVTSKGGTTHAALASLEADGVGAAFERALLAARARAEELGRPS
jgi:pyrroline-5-carboxylate reductase